MPISYQHVIEKIRKIASGAMQEEQDLNSRRFKSRELLEKHAENLSELSRKVGKVSENDSFLRCALPFIEPLNASTALPSNQDQPTLIAADGSQINPDRHSSVDFSLINIGIIVIKPGSGETPQTETFSELIYGQDLYTEFGKVGEDLVSLRRDLAERQKLLEVAEELPETVIALTDGPVEVWGLKQEITKSYREALQTHLKVLERMQDRDIILAGVVDKPGAHLVVRLLEIAQTLPEKLREIRNSSFMRGVTDRWLFSTLPPGARSAVFGLQSNARIHYQGSLALHFFYLNSSMDNHPNIVRVEVPAWVASDQSKLDLLHSSLIHQCSILGKKPYPYILHRAHEIALVTFKEKKLVEQMLNVELRKAGVTPDNLSNKQTAKDHS